MMTYVGGVGVRLEDEAVKIGCGGSVEILRELHVRRVIRRDEGPPEVANTPVY